jgi:hypothetical protein
MRRQPKSSHVSSPVSSHETPKETVSCLKRPYKGVRRDDLVSSEETRFSSALEDAAELLNYHDPDKDKIVYLRLKSPAPETDGRRFHFLAPFRRIECLVPARLFRHVRTGTARSLFSKRNHALRKQQT